jgi:hypothetical protein
MKSPLLSITGNLTYSPGATLMEISSKCSVGIILISLAPLFADEHIKHHSDCFCKHYSDFYLVFSHSIDLSDNKNKSLKGYFSA